jgi:hypothetical protein
VSFNDHVAEVDADAKPDLPHLGYLRLTVSHPSLHLHGAAHGIYNTRKFRQQSVHG